MNKAWEKRVKWLSIIALVLFAIVFGSVLFVFFTNIASDPQIFKEWLEQFGWFGKITLVLMVFLQVLVAFLPGEIIEVGAGVAFGAWEGMFLCLIGSALGTYCILVIVKRYGASIVEHFISKEKIESLSFLKNEEKLSKLIFIIFFIPGTPKDILTYFAGLTSMKVMRFVGITTVARIPSVITSTLAGDKLMQQDFTSAIVIYGVTLIVSCIGLLAYKNIVEKKRKDKTNYESKCINSSI